MRSSSLSFPRGRSAPIVTFRLFRVNPGKRILILSDKNYYIYIIASKKNGTLYIGVPSKKRILNGKIYMMK
jgi:hypothetical protein